MPRGDNTASSGECYNFFASVGRAGHVNIGGYGTSYPKGCWYMSGTRYFNTYTGTSGSYSSATAICRMPPYFEGAMNAQGHRNTGCIQALADDLGGTCNSVQHNTWTGRSAIEMGSSACYYASTNANVLCATIGSSNRRFCPCS